MRAVLKRQISTHFLESGVDLVNIWIQSFSAFMGLEFWILLGIWSVGLENGKSFILLAEHVKKLIHKTPIVVITLVSFFGAISLKFFRL